MTDFAAARRMMVDNQVRPADVTDPRLVGAMLDLSRERFLPDDRSVLAYLDLDFAVGGSRAPRRLLKPMVLAKLIQLADIGETDRVLDVGSATGYSAALLSRLAANVVALEGDTTLSRRAAEALGAAGVANVKAVTGPLVEGRAADGPYDVIVLEGATEIVPDALFRQLRDGGRLVCVMGAGPGGKGMLYRATDGDVSGRAVFEATATLLPGFARQPAFVF